MKTWRRVCDLSPADAADGRERWELWEDAVRLAAYDLHVRLGKPLDVLGLKAPSLSGLRDYAEHLHAAARDLYAPEAATWMLESCPACLYSSQTAAEAARVFDVAYLRCPQCGHLYVGRQPTPEALDAHFREDDQLAAAYTDKASVELRLEQVVMPKARWLAEIFAGLYGKPPAGVLDVGAGGGHFLEGMRRLGCRVAGLELSRASRAFAAQAFGLDLGAEDFLGLEPRPGEYDALTFWGLLEYTPQPRRFLEAARRWLRPGQGLLVLEAPRHECLGTAAQLTRPRRVARHLDPTSHVNCFSDAGLAFMLHDCGFVPVAAWYFGMDIYELLVQAAWEMDDPQLLPRLAHLIPAAQAALDAGRACDDIVLAAAPR